MTDPLFQVRPQDWEISTLGEVAARGGGSVQTGPFGSQLHASDYVSKGVPSVMPLNIGDNRIIEDGIARITEDDAQRLERHRLAPGDIVYSRRGDVERRALVRAENDGWLCGTGCLRVRLGTGHLIPEYAAYYLGHPLVRQWIVQHAVGATMPNLNTGILSALPIVVPPLSEQESIASVLAMLDDKIDLNRQMNETLEAMAHAIFSDWFVDFGPVRRKLAGTTDPIEIIGHLTPNPTHAAELAALFPDSVDDAQGHPIGWRVVKIGSCCSRIFSGGTPSSSTASYWAGGIPWLSSGETRKLVIDSTERTISQKGVENSSTRFAEEWSTVIASAGQGNTRGQTSLLAKGMYINQSVIALEADKQETTSELLFLDMSRRYAQLRQISDSNSSRGSLTTKMVASIETVVAPAPVMHRLSKVIEPLILKIATNEREGRTLAETRDYLLPRLMSGQVRVGDVELEATQ